MISHKNTTKCKARDCKMEFPDKEEMLEHYEVDHVNIKPYECTECEEKFKRKSQLKEHTFKHTKEFPFKCSQCDKGFIRNGALIRHEATHKSHICRVCSQFFSVWSELVAHQKISHPKTYKCADCDKTFASNGRFKDHQKVHTSKESRDVFECDFDNCAKFYFDKKNLINHRRIKHEGTKSFKCTHDGCDRVLSTKQKLEQHLQLHGRSTKSITRKPKKQIRRKRIDMGKSKVSHASILAGVVNPPEAEKILLADGGDAIEIDASAVESMIVTESMEESEIDEKTEKNVPKVLKSCLKRVEMYCGESLANPVPVVTGKEINVK